MTDERDRSDELSRERLERLDVLLAEAVPEDWTPEHTERVIAGLGLGAAPTRSRIAAWVLATAAALAALAIWGGPVLDEVSTVPTLVADAARDGLAAIPLASIPTLPLEPVAGAALLLLVVTLVAGARTARTIAEKIHA